MTKWVRWEIGLVMLGMVLPATLAFAGEPVAETASTGTSQAYRSIGLGVAAALTMAICVLGAGHAVGRIGTAAMGAAAEKPELLTRSLLFVALAEGLAVLGFAIAMMILQKI